MLSSDQPYPELIREMCARRAWEDGVDAKSRIVFELAADMIRELMIRCGTHSLRAERAEAERETLRRICYGPQQGGAA